MNIFFNFFKQYCFISLLVAYILYVVFFWDLQMLFPVSFIILFKLFKSKISSITISYLDIGFAILFLSEILTALNSSYLFNGISSYIRLSFMLILYIGCKSFFKDSQNQLRLQTVFVVFSAVLVVFTLNDFFAFQKNLELVGFTDSLNFKNLYNPLGYLINAWTTVLLFFLILNCLVLWQHRNKKWVVLLYLNLFMICFCILSSFSRGAYISLFVFIIIFNILVWSQFSLKKIILSNIIALLLIGVAAIPIYKDVLTTVSFNATESQKRSTSARLNDWQNTKELVKDKPIFGWGQCNFILAQDKVAYQKEDLVFCPRTQNTYINLLVERGVFGFISYLIFLAIILIVIIRNLKSKTILKNDKVKLSLIVSGILAILLREFTYASIFEFNGVYFVFFVLVFFLIPYDIPVKRMVSKRLKYSIPSLFLIAAATLLYVNISRVLVLEQNKDFLMALYKGDFKSSQSSINKAVALAPDNINIFKNRSLFLLKNNLKIEISQKIPCLLSIKAINKGALQLASKDLSIILKLNPYDDENLHNLAWIYFALGQQKAAQDMLNDAIKLDNYNSIYHISKLLFDLKENNIPYVNTHLVKVLRYSPEVLESIFYKEFSKKYPQIANESKQIAVSELHTEVKITNNPVLKARLARLLLDDNPNEAKQLLNDVTISLPNLSRPWMYLAYLKCKETNDSIKVMKYYKKSLFLNPNDFLLSNYIGDFYSSRHNEKKALKYFRTSLFAYGGIKSPDFARNYFFSNVPVSRNSIIPNNLLYYTAPDPQALTIFKAFEKYHIVNNTKHKMFYSKKVKTYTNHLFKREFELP